VIFQSSGAVTAFQNIRFAGAHLAVIHARNLTDPPAAKFCDRLASSRSWIVSQKLSAIADFLLDFFAGERSLSQRPGRAKAVQWCG
jgi:hypothetical protein